MSAERSYINEIEEQASLFALGALPSEDARHFQQRLAADCPVCRHVFGECERAVTALAFCAPEVAPPPSLRSRLLEGLEGAKPPAAKSSSLGVGTLVRASDTDWERSPIPGVTYRSLHERRTMLVRMAPNTVYPAHNHAAAEQCLVLEGSVLSEGVTAYAGDFTYMPAGSSHQPLYTESGCLLLIAYT